LYYIIGCGKSLFLIYTFEVEMRLFKSVFPTDESMIKAIYFAAMRITENCEKGELFCISNFPVFYKSFWYFISKIR